MWFKDICKFVVICLGQSTTFIKYLYFIVQDTTVGASNVFVIISLSAVSQTGIVISIFLYSKTKLESLESLEEPDIWGC